jgi:hypothetical protein
VEEGRERPPAALQIRRDADVLTYESRFLRGFFDLRARRGEVEGAVRGRALLGFLRALFGAALPERSGLLVHAAAVCRPGNADGDDPCGFLFLGASGAGKSTLARLAAQSGARVLGDEVVAARVLDRGGACGAVLFGTPLGSREGGLTSAACCALGTIVWLAQATAHELVPAPRSEAVRALLARAVAPPQATNPAALLDAATALVERAHVGELRFHRAPDFWTVLPRNPPK